MTQTELTPERKYRKGAAMQGVTGFVLVVLGAQKFFEGDELSHPDFGANWKIHQIAAKIADGKLFYAIPEDV